MADRKILIIYPEPYETRVAVYLGTELIFLKTLNHQEPGRIVVDFGSAPVTGIHVVVIEKLRERLFDFVKITCDVIN